MYTQGGRTIDQLQLHELVDVPLAVVDVSTACSADPDHQVPGFYLVLGGSWVAVSGLISTLKGVVVSIVTLL